MNQTAERPLIEAAPGSFSKRSTELAVPESGNVIAMQSNASSLLVAITQAARDRTIDMDKMERLFAMHQTIVAQERKAAYSAAMARAQAKMVPVVNNATNKHTDSSYAKLSAIHKAITPIYTEEGLSVSFDTETKNDADPIPTGFIRTVAHVSHSDGHTERRHIDLPPDDAGSAGNKNKTRVQAAGSTSSYARRYLCLMIFNVSTEDDNDGNGANKTKKRDDASGSQKKGEGTPPVYAESKFNSNFDTWKEMILKGEKTADAIIATISSKWLLSDQQKKKLTDIKRAQPAAPGVVTAEDVEKNMRAAGNGDALDIAADLISKIDDEKKRKALNSLYQQLKPKFKQ